MDHVIELERIDFAPIQGRKPIPHVIKQHSQLLLVIGADDLPCVPATCPFSILTSPGHRASLPPRSTPEEGNTPTSPELRAAPRRSTRKRSAGVAQQFLKLLNCLFGVLERDRVHADRPGALDVCRNVIQEHTIFGRKS